MWRRLVNNDLDCVKNIVHRDRLSLRVECPVLAADLRRVSGDPVKI